MAPTMTEFGKLPAVRIRAADGAQAVVTLFGAQLVSWQDANGRERLFCSARSARDGSRAIRGGVPVIFPQFGERGSGMRHGFARVCRWRVDDSGDTDGAAFARFALTQADLPASIAQAWPHAFALQLRVAVRANELHLALEVRNTGEAAFSFAGALHTYFFVDELEGASVTGLDGARHADDGSGADGALARHEGVLALGGKLDRIYHGVRGALMLACGPGRLRLEQSGFPDAVVWNPGAADAAALVDLDDEEYRRFVCIEPALIAPLQLAAGAAWRGEHRVTC